jgi:LytS/YehU family sensor histidine kinase
LKEQTKKHPKDDSLKGTLDLVSVQADEMSVERSSIIAEMGLSTIVSTRLLVGRVERQTEKDNATSEP